MRGLIVVIVAIALTVFTGIGGAILLLAVKKFDKKTWTGLKYTFDMLFNIKDMKSKELALCRLTGKNVKLTDDPKTDRLNGQTQ